MVNLRTIQAHNKALKSAVTSRLVAVFVGGTSGISLATALAFARYVPSPKIYLIGRNQAAAEKAIYSINQAIIENKASNSSSSATAAAAAATAAEAAATAAEEPTFLQADISLLKNVDRVCDEIKSREQKINLLFMTPGYLTLKGLDETAEGLDRKFVLHYYARMRFIVNLLPLLEAAAAAGEAKEEYNKLSRVVSVLDPLVSVRAGFSNSGKLDYSDLSLKHSFSQAKCAAHASLMGNFFLEGMAQRQRQRQRQQPGRVSFIHAYPSGVATGVMRDIPILGGRVGTAVLKTVLSPFMVPIEESGERHLFAATSPRFPPPSPGAVPLDVYADDHDRDNDIAMGSDGTKGSGCYWVNWDGEAFPPNKKLDRTRAEGAVEKVMQHTSDVFQSVCEEGKMYGQDTQK